MIAPRPSPALAACDDPASKLDMAWIHLVVASNRATAAVARFADVVWPIVEEHPPGWLNRESKDG